MAELVKGVTTRLWTPILPTVYSDTLSYMEQLSQFAHKLNELIDSYNTFAGQYENYVQEQLKPFVDRLNSFDTRLNTVVQEINDNFDIFKKEVNDEISDFKEETDAKIDTQNQLIADLRKDVNAEVKSLRTEMYEKLDAFQKEVYDKIEQDIIRFKTEITNLVSQQLMTLRKLIDQHDANVRLWVKTELDTFIAQLPKGQIIVTNPATGLADSLQQTLFDMYDYYRTDGLTARQYDDLEMTAEEYDNKGLTGYEYDFYSTRYLETDSRFYMYSPFTGLLVPISQIIYNLADLHKGENAFTADEYDEKEFTAEVYDNKELTAYEYDWKGKLLLVA